MKVKVRFLAYYRELVGSSEKLMELPEGSTVGSLVDELYRSYPRLAVQREEVIISVNKKQAADHQKLHDGDKAVLLPPAIGG